MTDERMGDRLWEAIERLPRGAAVIFRHYGLSREHRRELYEQVRTVTRRRGLWLLLAGSLRQAAAWKADGVYGGSLHRRSSRPLLRSAAVHDRIELRAARYADLRLVSPIHATRSHPGQQALGKVRLGLLLGGERRGIVALGGMNRARARALRRIGVTRWAAIDGLVRR
jgi:thiamine-phosphate pyrophosphorylase